MVIESVRHGRVSKADARDMDQTLRPPAKTLVYTLRIFIQNRSTDGCQPTTLVRDWAARDGEQAYAFRLK
jgi:hypothetical protein